ncbi:MAG TPA: polysaccharide biosynthesis/export family protein [Verrucomicrobiae bacterium]|nr:polysaccharide biosynthesis/export family protein [Verrucomicrobiae bacterium]
MAARSALLRLALIFGLLGIAGCGTPRYKNLDAKKIHSEPITLREGDVVRITFPGAPNLNTSQPIRRDGKIDLTLVGEVQAAGLTPEQLEKKLADLYSKQLLDKEVNVTVESSTFPVFVTGAVMRPGKVLSDHPITAIEAVMEAGGFDYTRANLKSVKVLRNINGQIEHIKLDLASVLQGNETEAFYLRPQDILYVPEKFNWF